MVYGEVVRLVLGGALVAVCTGSRLTLPTVKQNLQKDNNDYVADTSKGGVPYAHARAGIVTQARTRNGTDTQARTRNGTDTQEHARTGTGSFARGAAAATTNKHNDLILLLKNDDSKKHLRNIMIVNKHNEDRLRMYNEVGSAPAQPERLPPATPSRTVPSPGTGRNRASRGRRTTRAVQRKMSSAGAHAARAQRARNALPPADILDMAPARGSRVNAKRLKGRLCQRHVLLPEGPKYDGAGRAYLAAYAGSRPFMRTRIPRLLLPSCCNCCKKSVLGCE